MATASAGRGVIQLEDGQAAMSVLAFVPMAEAARPLLMDQFDRYLKYGLPIEQPVDAAPLVELIYTPITGDVA